MLTTPLEAPLRRSQNQLADWERGLLLGALLLTAVSAGMLLTGEGPRNLYRRWRGTLDPTGKPFARVHMATGDIKRQAARSARLSKVQEAGETLYFGDTLYTGEASSMRLELLPENGGGTFTVGPDTMIRISSTLSQQFGSLRKNSEIELIKGTIRSEKGQVPSVHFSNANGAPLPVSEEIRVAKIIPAVSDLGTEQPTAPKSAIPSTPAAPPLAAMDTPILSQEDSPPPPARDSDLELIKPQIIQPVRNAVLTATDFSGAVIELKWLLEGGSAASSWIIRSKESGKTVSDGQAPALAQGSRSLRLGTPGRYEFVLQVGNKRVSKEFTVDAKIDLSRPKSARLAKDAPSFAFDFPESLPGRIKRLRLELFRHERDDIPTLVREIIDPQERGTLEIPVEEIGKLSFFRWTASPEALAGPGSFVGMSPKTQILAELAAPMLTSPEPAVDVPTQSVLGEPLSIVFTWERVPLSEEYILEISKTPDFTTIEKSARTEANYLDFAMTTPGRYWWHVRSDSGRAPGAWSQPREFRVTAPQKDSP